MPDRVNIEINMDPLDDPKYVEYLEQMERQDRMAAEIGYAFHSACGQYALDISIRRTAQYGGGYDTFESCKFCGHKGVYV